MEYNLKPGKVLVAKRDQDGQIVMKDGKPVTVEAESPFEGWVTIKLLPPEEKTALVQKMQFKINDKGEVEKKYDDTEQLQKMYEIARQHIVKVEITRKEDGFKFDSVEMLGYDEDGCKLLQQAAGAIMRGVKLGKQ